MGKTRLALRVATRLRGAFPDGVWFVELSWLRDPDLVPDVVAETLRVCETTLGTQASATRDIADALADHLSDSHALLILDNCEHLVEPVARLVDRLLRESRLLKIIATSRTTLHVGGERVLAVPPLAVPDPDEAPSAAAVARFGAVRLFADRAAAASGAFDVTDGNHLAVARLCRRLEGNPLAIELAAVRTRAMPVERILQRLDAHFGLLTEGSRVGTPQLRDPRATIAWSHDLCSPPQRTLWRRLAVFRDGFDLSAAEGVCSGGDLARPEIWELVADLVDMSIVVTERRRDAMRYCMPGMIRDFGEEALRRSAEESWVRDRHAEHYLRLAECPEGRSMSRYQAPWLRRLRLERDNLHAAADHWLTTPGHDVAALRLTTALARDHLTSGTISIGRHWVVRALDRGACPGPARAEALWTAGWLTLLQGRTGEGLLLLRRCNALARAIGDASALRRVTQFTGLAAIFQKRYHRARLLIGQALADHQAAGDHDGAWLALYQLALTNVHLKDHERAIAYGERSLAICREHEASWAEGHVLWVTGLATLWCGRTREAVRLFREALRIQQALEDRWGLTRCLEALAWTAAADRPGVAARLLGVVDRLRRSIGSPPDQFPALTDARRDCRQALTRALGPSRAPAETQKGMDLPLGDAIALALDEVIPSV